ncbi:FAD-dependent monooxygenase [Mesorhizobium sp. M1374]|uniref:FAD-dependent monooxygenase n=1 Tax=Mesorhizobium sp. M1374 TaxID=2957091 RepID=UPI00333A30E9
MDLKGRFHPSNALQLEADAVIIGSGAGGASVADVLTAAGISVIMLEEGKHIPSSSASPIASEAFLAAWRSGGLTAAIGRPPLTMPKAAASGEEQKSTALLPSELIAISLINGASSIRSRILRRMNCRNITSARRRR